MPVREPSPTGIFLSEDGLIAMSDFTSITAVRCPVVQRLFPLTLTMQRAKIELLTGD